LSGRICYLARSDAGDRLESVRLVGPSVDEVWRAPSASVEADPSESAREAAKWVKRVLSDLAGKGSLDLVCLDPSGGVVGWLRAAGRDMQAAETLVRSGGGEILVGSIEDAEGWDEFGGEEASTGAGLMPDLAPGGATVLTAVHDGEIESSERAMVMAMRDASVRIFLNELDRRGVSVGSVQSIWHAMGAAWDPSGPLGRAPGEEAGSSAVVVAESNESCTAVVLADPDSGRANWSWSKGGRLVAGGSMYMGGGEAAGLDRGDLGRLEADWLAWSMQLGIEPSRIVVVMPPSEHAAGVGVRMGELRPSASVDLAQIPDPLGSTLTRLGSRNAMMIANPTDPRSSVPVLAALPGRASRSMFVFVSLGLLGLSAALGVYAWQLLGGARADRESGAQINAQLTDVYRRYGNTPATGQIAVLQLETIARRAKSELAIAQPPSTPRPILRELETLSFLLSAEAERSVRMEILTLESLRANMQFLMPNDIAAYEEFESGLIGLETSALLWRVQRQNAGNQFRVQVTGDWK